MPTQQPIYELSVLSLSSDPISKLSGVDQLCADDNWIFERVNVPTDHRSWKIRYDQLSSRIMYDISCRYGFNTMAYREKWQYARANHSHDYSIAACTPHVTYDDVVNAYSPKTKLMTFNISRAGYDRGDGVPHAADIVGVVSAIKRGDPTIVCLQEVDKNCSGTGNIDFLAEIRKYMGPSWNSEFLSRFNLESGQHGLGIIYDSRTTSKVSGASKQLLANGGYPIMMQVCEFTEFVVANVYMSSSSFLAQCQTINEYFFGSSPAYSGKTILLAGYFGAASTSDGVVELLKNFDIVSQANETSFVMVNKTRAQHLHNVKKSSVDDVSTTGYRPIIASFFYNDDYTKLDEWLASTNVWKLSTWEERCNNGKWSYRVLHKDYVPTQYDIYYPHIEFPKYSPPEVGEMNFLARSSFPTTTSNTNPRVDETGLMYDSEVDGYWAYPNGQTIACKSFEFYDACRLYGDQLKDGNDTSFTLPNLTEFFRACYPGMKHDVQRFSYDASYPTTNQVDVTPLQHFDKQICVPNHTHTVDTTMGDNVHVKDRIVIPSANAPAGGNSTNLTHSGGQRLASESNSFLKSVQIEIKEWNSHANPTFTDFSSQDLANIDTYPTHQHMPAIVYIGKR